MVNLDHGDVFLKIEKQMQGRRGGRRCGRKVGHGGTAATTAATAFRRLGPDSRPDGPALTHFFAAIIFEGLRHGGCSSVG